MKAALVQLLLVTSSLTSGHAQNDTVRHRPLIEKDSKSDTKAWMEGSVSSIGSKV